MGTKLKIKSTIYKSDEQDIHAGYIRISENLRHEIKNGEYIKIIVNEKIKRNKRVIYCQVRGTPNKFSRVEINEWYRELLGLTTISDKLIEISIVKVGFCGMIKSFKYHPDNIVRISIGLSFSSFSVSLIAFLLSFGLGFEQSYLVIINIIIIGIALFAFIVGMMLLTQTPINRKGDKMRPKISVIGAGNVGATLAQCLAVKNIADIVLLDIVEGLPQGKALDLQESAPVSGFNSIITGTNSYEDTAKSDVVIVTSGIARKPGMSRDDLIRINSGIVIEVTKNIVKYSPDCVIIVVANPVDTMTYLTVKVSGFPANRVFGLSGVLDSARLSSFIAMELKVPMTSVNSYALGEHGQNMVVFPRFATVNGKPITELLPQETIDKLINRAVNGGAEIVGLLKTGSAFYAPAASAARMAEAVILDKKEVLPCAAYLQGEYNLSDVVIGVPVKLGSKGIEEIVDFKLTEDELAALKKSSEAVRALISTLGV